VAGAVAVAGAGAGAGTVAVVVAGGRDKFNLELWISI